MGDGRVATAEGLSGSLETMLPRGVRGGARAIRADDVAMLLEAERRVVERAVAARRAEYGTGRVLLRHLVGTAAPIGTRVDRTPAWPEGLVGSLAHDDRFVVAAVSSLPGIRSIGLDIEPVRDLDRSTAALIVRPDEDVDPLVAFVAKEAAYKAWHGIGGGMLEHHDVRVVVRGDLGTRAPASFEASVVGGPSLPGWCIRSGDRWLASVVVAASGG